MAELLTDTRDVETWIREILDGGSFDKSFQRIYELYFAPVTHFFINRGFHRPAAEDLAQEAFIRVYKYLGEFRFEASFETWLFRIVVNVWKNALRSRATLKRLAQKEVSLDEILALNDDERSRGQAEPGDPAAGPLEQALGSERTRILTEALDELPPKMRDCVLLRLGQGLKYREIASLMHVSIATVKTQLSTAYKRLKPLLKENVFEL